MNKMLGIYFGPKVISLVESKGKSVINSLQIQRSVLSSGEIEEKVPDEVKVVALFKEELRKNKIEAQEAALCLSGKDLIIRSFEIPMLPANELSNVISFEAKKYIPFKAEELFFDFQVKLDRSTRRNQVLYVGIKKETLDRYLKVMNQLNIKVSYLEYSAFSVLRFLKLANLGNNGITAVVVMDLNEQDEVNFTILENGFPLFSRDITLTEGSEGPFTAAAQAAPAGSVLDKLKNEIRISLDYYQRKFALKKIARAFFMCNEEYRQDLELFFQEVGFPAQFINTSRYIGKQRLFSLGFIKSYSASLAATIKTGLKINILTAKVKTKPPKESIESLDIGALFSGVRPGSGFIVMSILICLFAFVFGIYRQFPMQKELRDILSQRPKVADINSASSAKELNSLAEKDSNKINTLDNLLTNQFYLTEILDAIPRIMPSDIRLTNLYFKKKEDSKADITMQGIAYVGDSDKELRLINAFAAALKDNAVLKKYFKEVNVQNIDHRQLDKATVTNFTISLKS
ncbi:MAG: pilus assembly protein PilM [Candidatus Omnitrophica bacterium]|jgi:hypothetical protein|nr:pilus assembly protein PilM [Candidatus Omnitrophota bacterium]